MRSDRLGGAGQSSSHGSPSSQIGPNCHTAWPRSHMGRRHENAVPVDEGRGSPVVEHGVAGRDVTVAHDAAFRDRLRTLLESGLRLEVSYTVVVGPQQAAHRLQRARIQLPSLRIGRDPSVDPGQRNPTVVLGPHHAGRPGESGPLQMQEQLPHRLGVRRSRAEHRVANPNELGHPPSERFSLTRFASPNHHVAERNGHRTSLSARGIIGSCSTLRLDSSLHASLAIAFGDRRQIGPNAALVGYPSVPALAQ